MITKISILTFVLIAFTSCSTVSTLKTDDVQISELAPTNIDAIEVYSTKTAPKDYKIIGQVIACADAGEDAEIAVKLLKEQAALLGADAIVELKLHFSMGYWSVGIKANGTAIKYN